MSAGNQLQDKLQAWLSPPNPSINHNTACEIQHDGTATWFIHGNTFREWKENGSLLWIRGNRKLLLPFLPVLPLIISLIYSRCGKKYSLVRRFSFVSTI
jgi:hypothetical protein